MSTLLSLIGESERFRIKPKNIEASDDVTENGFSSYLEDYGKTAIQDYTEDVNEESPSVSDVGIIALRDSKDYNLNPKDIYDQYDNNPIDVSVIDMPEIEEISEAIYLSSAIYNKYANLDYIPFEIQDPNGVQNQQENYGDYIADVLDDLERRGNSLADIFIGQWNKDDSPIGVIGGQALNNALNTQFTDGVSRKVLGLLNTNVFSLLDGGSLIREDYDITVPKTKLGRSAEFVAKLGSLENPINYLPEDVFGFNRLRTERNGIVTYIGTELSYEEQVSLLLQYTGKGQEKQLLNLVDLNIYKPKIEGRTKTIQANEYVGYTHFNKNSLDIRDFTVDENTAKTTPYGYYEPYGVISRHKNTGSESFGSIEKQIFSDGFWFVWTNDITDLAPTSVIDEAESIGWVAKTNVNLADTTIETNPFKKKSLLYRTQNLVNQGNAFLDLSKKEFVENIDGESRIISRGDAITASKTYTDDDGKEIQQGEYFRVWTKQRGYNRLDRTLRHRGLDNGDTRSVLNQNGIPNYAPTIREADGRNGLINDAVIKRYMFSIENLAWNDYMDDLPECEQGPGDPVTGVRGRIMWFPPYDLNFDENVSVQWEGHNFIGRGEKIYTYNNVERSGTLSFTIPVDNPDIIHSLVGERTQYWERYFKGDKTVEADAKDRYKLKKNISQKDLESLNKIKKPIEPIVKKVPYIIKTEKKVIKEKAKKVKEKVDQGKYGQKTLSIYFPNNVFVVPRSTFKPNLDNVSSDAVEDKTINFVEMAAKNVGYEDGGAADGFKSSDAKPYTIFTSNGLEYKDFSGKIVNTVGRTKQATYEDGSVQKGLQIAVSGCKDIDREGWQDTTNFGLNVPFYFEWQIRFFDSLKDKTKVEINFIGNASLPGAANSRTNTELGIKRANNAKEWFKKNVIPFLEKQGINIGFTYKVDSKSDLEDQERGLSGLVEAKDGNSGDGTYCGKCSRPHLLPCKKSRRVDIYIKDLSEPVEEEPEPEEPEVNVIEDVVPNEAFTIDETQNIDDPDSVQVPDIDESVLNKLVYTECDYFKYLETYDPLAYQTISEKIKYFVPAFHSMTPQGWNSRLTFLHQCTRQSDSIGLDGVDNIKNLAFGRPPVCILRIGDFFHTKIIIESMSINYKGGDSITWDTNPEGIGVQPMFANVNLQIKILGGMSMTAPINRLQNALSFNFYANTEMYDARADSVVFNAKYGEDGEGNVSLDENATFGSLQAARIVDGVKLSSLFKYSEAQKAEKLKKVRLESRLTLQNSTNDAVPTDQIQNLGQVESLLEYKKSAGLPLTSQEKKYQSVIDNSKVSFNYNGLTVETNNLIKSNMQNNLATNNSLLNNQALEVVQNENSLESLENFKSSISQYLTSITTEEITPEVQESVSEDYLNVFKDTYINRKGFLIEY